MSLIALNRIIKRAALLITYSLSLFVFTSCTEDGTELSEEYILRPYGGEIIYSGTQYFLLWNIPGFPSVNIELIRQELPLRTIAEFHDGPGYYSWKLPEDIPEGSGYRIRITATGEPARSIVSGEIEIRKPGETDVITDERDGQSYRIVKIGEQWWMAENFNLATGSSFCYDNIDSLCESFGRLYTFESALGNAPDGWHLPTDRDWKQLEEFLGIPSEELEIFGRRGKFSGYLLEEGGGSGFKALPGGYFSKCKNASNHKLYEADFWTADLNDDGIPIIRIILRGSGYIIRYPTTCQSACSVRYIKDAE